MNIPSILDTAQYRKLVLQLLNSIGNGGGGVASTNSAVGPDGVTRVPLNVNSAGELKVNVEASINADLSLIEGKLDTIIGIETPQAADVATIKTNTTGVATSANQNIEIASLQTIAADTALIKASSASIAGMAIPANNYISLGYTSGNLTSVVYKTGGSGGTTVATLTLAYSGSDLISVTKS